MNQEQKYLEDKWKDCLGKPDVIPANEVKIYDDQEYFVNRLFINNLPYIKQRMPGENRYNFEPEELDENEVVVEKEYEEEKEEEINEQDDGEL